MAQVPYQPVPESVPQERVPDDTYHIQTNPGQFGGLIAQGEQRLGAGLEDVNHVWQSVQTTNVVNQTMASALGEVERFKTLQGADAINQKADTQATLQKIVNDGAATLGSVNQNLQYNNEMRAYLNRFLAPQIDSHANQQALSFAGQQNDWQQQHGLSILRTADPNSDASNQGLEMVTKAALTNYQLRAGHNPPADPDQAKAWGDGLETAVNVARADARAVQVESLLKTNPAAAKAFYDQHLDELRALSPNNLYKGLPTFDRLSAQVDGAIKGQAAEQGAGEAYQAATLAYPIGGASSAQPPAIGYQPAALPTTSLPPTQSSVENGKAIAQVWRQRGWSDAAIIGGLNNGMGESGLQMDRIGAAGEEGPFQLNPATHLPIFQEAYKGAKTPEAYANYVADVVEKTMPGYAQSTDPSAATGTFTSKFERPADAEGQAVARVGFTNTSQSILHAIAEQPPTTSKFMPPGQSPILSTPDPLQVEATLLNQQAFANATIDASDKPWAAKMSEHAVVNEQFRNRLEVVRAQKLNQQDSHVQNYNQLQAEILDANENGKPVPAEYANKVIAAQSQGAIPPNAAESLLSLMYKNTSELLKNQEKSMGPGYDDGRQLILDKQIYTPEDLLWYTKTHSDEITLSGQKQLYEDFEKMKNNPGYMIQYNTALQKAKDHITGADFGYRDADGEENYARFISGKNGAIAYLQKGDQANKSIGELTIDNPAWTEMVKAAKGNKVKEALDNPNEHTQVVASPAPNWTTQQNWDEARSTLPFTPDGRPYPQADWEAALKRLAANPSPQKVKEFTDWFHVSGQELLTTLHSTPPAREEITPGLEGYLEEGYR